VFVQALLEELAGKVNVVIQEQPAFRVGQDQWESRAREVKQDSLELPDSKEFQVEMDGQDRPDLQDCQDREGSQDFQDSLVYRVWKDHRVQKDSLDSQVSRV